MPALSLALLLLSACATNTAAHSALFEAVFRPENKGIFRGISPGDALDKARRAERGTPRLSDRLGLGYRYALPEKGGLRLSYFADNVLTGLQTDRIASIVAVVRVSDEIQAEAFRAEALAFWQSAYGAPDIRPEDGDGKYLWRDEQNSMEFSITLSDDKREITLNIVPFGN